MIHDLSRVFFETDMLVKRSEDREPSLQRRESVLQVALIHAETASHRLVQESEFDSELKLEDARQIHLSGGLAEVGTGNVRGNTSETNIVEEIERIGPERKPEIFANLKIPGEAQVLIKETWVAKPVGACRRSVTVGERGR